MTSGGLIVITAHPDDEVLIGGGALAACAERGIPTGVVCLTRGEEGPIGEPGVATREALPKVRVAELRASCHELGVDWVHCYTWADGMLQWSDAEAIVGQLEGMLAEHRPNAVITFGPDGLYYHPDHIATHEFTVQAAGRLPRAPDIYRSAWPADLMRELIDVLTERALPTDLWGLHPSTFGVGAEDQVGAVEIDVRAHARRKLAALRCHRTQVGSGHAFFALPDDLVERFLGVERYVPLQAEPADGWLEQALGAVRLHA